MRTTKALFATALVLLAAACSPPYEDEIAVARGIYPSQSPFKDHLAQEYSVLATRERAEVDFVDADWFASRADMSGSGTLVMPVTISSRNVPLNTEEELSSERFRLVTALNDGGRSDMPALAANAQAMFDCWVQEQEENMQMADVDVCRNLYLRAMAKLMPPAEPAPAMPVVEAPPAPEGPVMLAGPFFIYFEHDSDVVDASAEDALAQTLGALEEHPEALVFLRGHTDLSGSDAYNQDLSQRRSRNAAAALTARGVPLGIIQREYYGEARPKVPTPDQERLRTNRRVEIWLHKS